MPSTREYPRAARVAVQLQREIDELVREHFSDACLDGITITSVDVSPDLRNARVYVSRLGKPVDDACAFLEKVRGRLRGWLGKRLKLRRVPELTFLADVLPDEADRMNLLIREARARDRDEDDEDAPE
ncbi:30S ribosome-binding factor RbfA [Algiphilus sp.]|uniref:30S ribosome-binding factor RbfA n=1 Tax=Algiphilus sp. TaxID=1872431 RepID=UPI001CA7298A|nr:30S ribosome-binding factor RbfA [Algiphilus sp.]MBY8966486.1 30S ribosome-binding factor RbfA [Algiphilus acroporae]MCI5062082.1 30S ribosome-binding factor RbfA [Algiphilus sp.]MCI5103494.1 30S ribosome-binding factor RbfA [Algiphilus sp.]